jgi:hypothetical protein
MRALFIAAIAAASLSSISANACALPNIKPGTVSYFEKGPGYFWTTNSDGYVHLMVVNPLITASQKAALRVSCTAMEQVLRMGGRFAVVAIGYESRGITGDVLLPNIQNVDPYDTDFDPKLWQAQAATVRQSRVAAGVAQILTKLQENGVDRRWEILFIQDDRAGATLKWNAKREGERYYTSYQITFTGDFRNPQSAGYVLKGLNHSTDKLMRSLSDPS